MNRRLWIAAGAGGALLGVLGVGLRLKPNELPSALVGKPVPPFSLGLLDQAAGEAKLSPKDYLGRPWLLNVFASWCAACRDEHPLLLEMAREARIELVGLNYKDDPADARSWLVRMGGNPYRSVLVDRDGRVGIDLGVYGVPETFAINAAGIVRMRHVGPLTVAAAQALMTQAQS